MSWPILHHELVQTAIPLGLVVGITHYNGRFYVKIVNRTTGEEEVLQQLNEADYTYTLFDYAMVAGTVGGVTGTFNSSRADRAGYTFKYDTPQKKPDTWYEVDGIAMSAKQVYLNEIEAGNLP